jgi:hypothetical protein
MSLMTKQDLALLGTYVATRTERGDGIIKRDPRQMPRRLRVLLLAIDGSNHVDLYTKTLKGFGDVSELLVELINLGLVKLVEPELDKQQKAAGRKPSFAALDEMLDDSRFDSEVAAEVLYGGTTPGSFEDMLRVARIEKPEYKPPPAPPPAPVPVTDQKAQIESVFKLLDSVRGERKHLKHKLAKLQRVKESAVRLHHENQRLQNWVLGLGIACAMLVTGLLLMLMQRFQ